MEADNRFPARTTFAISLALVALPFAVPSVTLASEVVIFATGALSCVLLLGSVGLLSFGQGLYFGIGAYVAGIALRDHSTGTATAVLLAMVVSVLVALPIGWLIVRRKGVYFVMLTFAFAQLGFFAMLALKRVTGGENGLAGVPRPVLAGGDQIANQWFLYGLLAAMFFVAFAIIQRINASPLGTVLRAIRSNEARAEALGYSVRLYKLAAFAVAAAIAGLGGAMNVMFMGFVAPSNMDLESSERLLIMALIGGVGSPAGALVGAAFYSVLADILGQIWSRWMISIALLLILIVLFLKGGLWGALAELGNRVWRARNVTR
jgi:branched-chain amino acid transport system permease protein